MKLIKVTERQIIDGRIREVGEVMPARDSTNGQTLNQGFDVANKAKITSFRLQKEVKEVKPKEKDGKVK